MTLCTQRLEVLGGHKPPYPIIDKDNTNIRYVLKSQVLTMRRKVRGK